MGNCLVLQGKKEIRIMMMDGKILSYQSPLKVQQVLSDFPGHVISDTLSIGRHLEPTSTMRSGHLYYLLQPKAQAGVVRVKLVISKQELKEMLSKEGFSLDAVMLSSRNSKGKVDDKERGMGWKPALESIPEGKDIY